MTATPILEALSQEFSASVDHVRSALEMLDAGLSSPFIGRIRRGQVGPLTDPEVMGARLDHGDRLRMRVSVDQESRRTALHQPARHR